MLLQRLEMNLKKKKMINWNSFTYKETLFQETFFNFAIFILAILLLIIYIIFIRQVSF